MKLIIIIAALLMTNGASQSVIDSNEDQSIIFIYNADSGWFNGLTDYVHKIVSPETYNCNLCAITYGNLGMKRQWSNYLKNLSLPVKFLHKDEIVDKSMTTIALPAIILSDEQTSKLMASAEEINDLTSLDDLIALMNDKLKSIY